MAFVPARRPSAAAGCSPVGGPRDASVCPPERGGSQSDRRAPSGKDAACRVSRLKRRPEFLAVAASGRRWVAPCFVLQVGPRPATAEGGSSAIGIGFTASRRIGNAVARNRAKRRLVAAARRLLPGVAAPGYDYVLVARSAVLTCSFQDLLDELAKAFPRVLTSKPRPARQAVRPARRR